MSILVVGINLAKTAFAAHAVNEVARAALIKPVMVRDKHVERLVVPRPWVMGMEVCSSGTTGRGSSP